MPFLFVISLLNALYARLFVVIVSCKQVDDPLRDFTIVMLIELPRDEDGDYEYETNCYSSEANECHVVEKCFHVRGILRRVNVFSFNFVALLSCINI